MSFLKSVLFTGSIILAVVCAGCGGGGGGEPTPTPTSTPTATPTPTPAVSKPLQTPCEGRGPLTSHAYSECGPDGFWHVVQDDAYDCPPVTTFRVLDELTTQRCKEGAGPVTPPPNPTDKLIKVLGPDCQSPKFIGRSVTFSVCTGGQFVNFTYPLQECADGTRGRFRDADSIKPTGIRCDAPPPPPQVPPPPTPQAP
jgi:hypothetical protein